MLLTHSPISMLANTSASCQEVPGMNESGAATRQVFGAMPDGREVGIYTLVNRHGLEACLTDYGAILVSMKTPDASGKLADITLGFDTLDGWLANESYFGATVGRFGNRIKSGKFTLDGKEYTLATNSESGGIPCHLHGGIKGFDKALWSANPLGPNSVEFTYLSQNGEEGYPGNLSVKVTYTLTDDNELIWEAAASTDAPTIVNIIHHSYWNLGGNPTMPATGHELTLHARHFLPTDTGMIPTGEIRPVAGTPMDFTTPHLVGERIDANYEPLIIGGGYDHCFVLENAGEVKPAARLRDPQSGRVMEVFTDQPGIQFYAGNFIGHSTNGKNGVRYPRRSGLCLETQRFPDSPNQPGFPSCILRPGDVYRHTLVHKFSVS